MKAFKVRMLKTALCCTLPLAAAQACGPDFYPDVFVRNHRPDLPKQFVEGRLGLLQTGFERADFFVAYRYLTGGTLDADEQKGWQPVLSTAEEEYAGQPAAQPAPPQPEDPFNAWGKARSQYPGAPAKTIDRDASQKIKAASGYEYQQNYRNCADDAFRVATATLQARTAAWGMKSPLLQDWLRAQDVVFNNCSGDDAQPSAAPSGSPTLLLQDRAYQIAAAHLYGGAYGSAAAEFVTISADKGSPWQPSSGYLAARALLRQAFFARPGTGDLAEYDPILMQAAARQLRSFLQAEPPLAWRRPAEALLALVRVRTEPEARLHELAVLVGGPGHDSHYRQDVRDLLWLMNRGTPDGLRAEPEPWQSVPDPEHPGQLKRRTATETEAAAEANRDAAWKGSQPERSAAEIADWTLTVQSLSSEAPRHALEQWRKQHTPVWLVAAIMLTPKGEGPPEDLLAAAAAVATNSPAWQTVTYHRARLLLGAHRVTAAREVLANLRATLEAVPSARREPSTVNAIRGLAMLAAADLQTFLSQAPRTVLLTASEEASSVQECREVMEDPKRHYACVEHVSPNQLDADAAAVLNTQAPLSVWLAAVRSAELPDQLRTAIAAEGWVRAILLKDQRAAQSFLPDLPADVREQAAEPTPLAPWMTLARNPGLRPYLDAGTQRAYSYDFVESYRDNWCYQEESGGAMRSEKPVEESSLATAAFMNAGERKQAAADAASLAGMRSLNVGRQIVRAVQANPKDTHAAEALFLVLRMIRYGCTEPAPVEPTSWQKNIAYTQEAKDLLQLKLETARLLRKYYAPSPWTKKAAPFAG